MTTAKCCPKCGSGKFYLHYDEKGKKLDRTKMHKYCLDCGYQTESRPVVQFPKDIEIANEDKATVEPVKVVSPSPLKIKLVLEVEESECVQVLKKLQNEGFREVKIVYV